MKEKLLKAKAAADKFLQSDHYLAAIAVFILVFHIISSYAFNAFYAGAAVLAIVAVYVLFTNKDLSPLIPVIATLIFMTPRGFKVEVTPGLIAIAVSVGVPFLAGIVFYFLKNKPKFKKSKQLVPFLVFSALLFASGLFSKFYARSANFLNILQLIGLNAVVIVFLFFTTDKLDFDYIAKILLAIGALAAAELLFLYASYPDGAKILIERKGDVHLGWGNSNSIGIVLGIVIPAAFYLAYRSEKYWFIFVAAGILIYASGFLTMSRNSLLVTTVMMPLLVILLFFSFKDKKKRRMLAVVSGVCAVIAIIVGALLMGTILDRWAAWGDSGRFDIWGESIDAFKKHPIFGVGFAYDESPTKSAYDVMYIVHNTFLQYLASGGIVGLLSWGFFTVCRYLLFWKNWKSKTPGFMFMLAAVLINDACGMLEPNPFLPYIVILTALVFTAAEKPKALPDADADPEPTDESAAKTGSPPPDEARASEAGG